MMGRKAIDITGQRFGRLVAEKSLGCGAGRAAKWRCRCDCGNVIIVSSNHLRKTQKSCGCIVKENGRNWGKKFAKDLTGQRCNMLVAIQPTKLRDKNGSVVWTCLCDCGKRVLVSSNTFVPEKQYSCGCIREKSIKGVRFGRLVGLRRDDGLDVRYLFWHFRCDCGNVISRSKAAVVAGLIKSCGCYLTSANMARFANYSPDDVPFELAKSQRILGKVRKELLATN
ncbi:hypothetical protein LCGC14_1668660 [marine sediment metagenome]|uniref:Uncharacterized protein n=1 Tax=marine sediment metagenome TaxID=412755 RepID=A0A0F9HRX4_9ZZZZ